MKLIGGFCYANGQPEARTVAQWQAATHTMRRRVEQGETFYHLGERLVFEVYAVIPVKEAATAEE